MLQSTSTASDLGLRPIPGPAPVELPTNDWWLWLVPLVLIGFMWYWWFRRPVIRKPTSKDHLNHAIEQAGDISIDARVRYQELHQSLRRYLTDIDPRWKSITTDDSLPHWQKMFPDQAELANQWHAQWQAAEATIFGPDTVTENQVADYARIINELDLELTDDNEKEVKSTDLGRDRNKS